LEEEVTRKSKKTEVQARMGSSKEYTKKPLACVGVRNGHSSKVILRRTK